MPVLNNTILYEPQNRQICSPIAHSILLIRADDAHEIVFCKCNGGFERHAIGDRVNIIQELCDIAVTRYIDCPRAPLLVRNGSSCIVLLRCLMRCTGMLMVLEPEPDSIINVMSEDGDMAQIDVTVFDAVTQKHLPQEGEAGAEFNIAPYYMMFGAEGSVVRYAHAVAEFVGCTLAAVGDYELVDDYSTYDKDTDVIGAMLILLILLFRRTTAERLVEFEMVHDGASLRVRLHAALRQGIDINGAEELEECNRIARMHNMMFDYCVSDNNVAEFELCATDIEWSHLGIKTRSKLEYDQ